MDPPPPPYPTPHLYPPPITAVSAAPTITPATVEAQNNIITTTHVAANPTPAPNPAPNHPPYAEMIYGAITALREKDGSSKRAIEKYIERCIANFL